MPPIASVRPRESAAGAAQLIRSDGLPLGFFPTVRAISFAAPLCAIPPWPCEWLKTSGIDMQGRHVGEVRCLHSLTGWVICQARRVAR